MERQIPAFLPGQGGYVTLFLQWDIRSLLLLGWCWSWNAFSFLQEGDSVGNNLSPFHLSAFITVMKPGETRPYCDKKVMSMRTKTRKQPSSHWATSLCQQPPTSRILLSHVGQIFLLLFPIKSILRWYNHPYHPFTSNPTWETMSKVVIILASGTNLIFES